MNYYKDRDGTVFAFESDYNGDLITPDLTPINESEKASLLAPPPQSQEELIKKLEDVVHKHIDIVVKSEGFFSVTSFTQYLGYPNDFNLKAEHVGAYIASVWVYSNAQKALLMDGLRATPTPEEYLLELPQYTPYAGT